MYCEAFENIPLDVRRDIHSIYLDVANYDYTFNMALSIRDEYKEIINKKVFDKNFYASLLRRIGKLNYLFYEGLKPNNSYYYGYEIYKPFFKKCVTEYFVPYLHGYNTVKIEKNIYDCLKEDNPFEINLQELSVIYDESVVEKISEDSSEFLEKFLSMRITKSNIVLRELLNQSIKAKHYPSIRIIITHSSPNDILYVAVKAIELDDECLFDLALSINKELLITRALLAHNYNILRKIFKLSSNMSPLRIYSLPYYTSQQKILILRELKIQRIF